MWHPQQILDFCIRRYPHFLRSLVTQETFFPLEVPFRRPRSSDAHATLVREVQALVSTNQGYRIEWGERNFRVIGRQRLPVRICFENAGSYLKAINKVEEARIFASNLDLTRSRLPALLDWIIRHPEKMAFHGAIWPDILEVCDYFMHNPRPGLFIRELPIQVDTKFIEHNKAILDSLLQHLCPGVSRRPGESFEVGYGLRVDEPLIRFRPLDSNLQKRLGLVASDLSIPLSQFQQLHWSNILVIVTENKMNFLTLPPTLNSLGIWGGGGAAQLLTSVPWLNSCKLIYWGDIDTHGFHIAARLRAKFQQLVTVMMDTATLDRYPSLLVRARESLHMNISTLSSEERLAYSRVKNSGMLLEQEKIPYDYAVTCLNRAVNSIVDKHTSICKTTC